jgi:hypothetical protein
MTDQATAADRLARDERQIADLRRAFSDLERRAREVVSAGKKRRDEGLLDALRRRLGI